MMCAGSLARFIRSCIVAALAVFVCCCALVAGATGPVGPLVVVGILNAPVRVTFDHLGIDPASDFEQIFWSFAVVIVNGALYGLVAGLLVSAGRTLAARLGRK